MTEQLVQCVVNPNGGGPEFYTTFIYAHNDAGAREKLWKDLEQLHSKMTGPWLLMGDFNCVINLEERLGSAVRVSEMDPPRRCFELCGLQDIPYSGHFYTWTNKQLAQDRVFSKLDRLLANETWMDKYDTGNAVFLTEGCSDHCPMVIRMDQGVGKGRKPFKYYKIWQSAADYTERIRNAWNTPIHGTSMFVVTQKLKQVKKSLKELNNTGYCSIQVEEAKAFNKLIQIQEHLHQNPLDNAAMEEERQAQQMYKTKNKSYISFLKQKAKIQWIRDGDENSALFHSSIKRRRLQNNVYAIKDHGNWQDSPIGVEQAFVNYYQELLGQKMEGRWEVKREIVQQGPVLNDQQQERLIATFTDEDIKKAFFSMNGDNAPGPDGFGAHFYKHNWDIVGPAVMQATRSFLESGKLLQEMNSTFLTLIPKVQCPQDVSEFRPIACCNTLYKGITKLLCSRLKEVLPNLISENQGAFVHGRYIVHNIMVCQDLVRKYRRKNSSPSCMIKLDLRKAYDTVEWNFIEEMM
ncbi:hypothetical protein RDABS01_014950 [Bienertia sinuspersici]